MRGLSRAPRAAGVAAAWATLWSLACAGGPPAATTPEAELPPAWEQPPPPPSDAPILSPGALRRIELDNGLHLIVLEDRRLPYLTLTLTVRRGEADVPLPQAGLASFTADLMERGAAGRDALALAESFEALGASFSAEAGWDSMRIRVSGLSRDLEALLQLLADVVLRPRLAEAEAQRLRGEVLASLERAKDDPATLAAWQMAASLYPGHRFGLPRAGTPESVQAFDASRARELYRRLFVPGNAILTVSGDVDAEAITGRAGELFGSWSGGELPAVGPPPPPRVPLERRVVVVDRPELGQARIVLAQEGIERGHPERVTAQLLNSVLGGGGFSSRLMESLRSEAGLTYGVYSAFDLRRSPGPFLVSSSTRVPEVRAALDRVLAELARIRREPPGERELRDAQTLLVGEFSLGLETSTAIAGSLTGLDVYGLPEDSLDTYRGRVRAVAPEDTASLAASLLHPDRALIVLVGPAEQLKPQLEGLGPIEVVRP